jgi:hypothetical protein
VEKACQKVTVKDGTTSTTLYDCQGDTAAILAAATTAS